MHTESRLSPKIVKALEEGKVGVLPSDTLYGISASALQPRAVARAARLRGREKGKPFIILIADVKDLGIFGVRLSLIDRKFLRAHWPGRVSVVFAVTHPKWKYLHMGRKSLAFRVPDRPALRSFLKKTGPLISTSVNPPGLPPATTIAAAKKYFPALDFYVDQGRLQSPPSTLVVRESEGWRVLREGAEKISLPDGSRRRRMIK